MTAITDPTFEASSGSSAPWWTRRDTLACLLCIAVGVFLAVAPHLTNLVKYGSPEFLADNDDVFYLALTRAPYYGAWSMRDGYLPPAERVTDVHAWAQFLPLAKLGRALGIPLILNGALWRVLGGCLLAFALYLIFRKLFASSPHATAWALGCTLICLCDAGFLDGRSLIEDVKLLPHLLHGTTPINKPDALAHFRVVTPLLNIQFLILMVAALIPVTRGGKIRPVLAGVWLGICTLLLFYLWTAAVMALSCYCAVLLLRKRPEAKAMAIVVALGLAIGAPQIVSNYKVSKDPAMQPLLERSGRPAHLPSGDPQRKAWVVNFWVWIKLAAGGIGVLVLGQPGLALLWWLVLSGYLLSNVAVLTGLEFENFHWVIVHAPMGEILLLATLVLLLERWLKPAVLAIPVALLLLFAIVWRPYEVLHAPMAVSMTQALQQLRPLQPELAKLGPDRSIAGPWQTQVAMLHSQAAELFDVPYTPALLIPMEEVNERHALNAWLEGLDYAAYLASPTLDLTLTEFGASKPEWQPANVAKQRVEIFRRLLDQPSEAARLMDRYTVTDLLLPASAAAPSRGGPWTLTGQSSAWKLWSRTNQPHGI